MNSNEFKNLKYSLISISNISLYISCNCLLLKYFEPSS